jgi:hypothetical protein
MVKAKKIFYIITGIIFSLILTLVITNCGSSTSVITVPTSTPTAVSTFTPVPTATPQPGTTPTATPVATNPDLSNTNQFTYNAVLDTFITTTATGNTAKLTVQIREVNNAPFVIKDAEIRAVDNPSFPFPPFGGTGINDGINDPPADWVVNTNPTLYQWTGNTPLTANTVYSFHISYSSVPTLPDHIRVELTGVSGTNQHADLGYLIIPTITHINPGSIDITPPPPPQ